MINTNTKYIVYSHNGGGVRHHDFGVQNNIINEVPGQASAGDTISAIGFPMQVFNGSIVPFAFMSVHGAADGNHLFTSAGNQPVSVGNTDIDILVVYAPPGGIGSQGGPGIWVDAFNVDTGDFSDDLHFIQVLTPPTPPDNLDNAKTVFANQEGEVSTINAEHIRASTSVDGGAPFVEWKKITPPQSIIVSRDVDIAQNQTGEIWFAFYQTPNDPHLRFRKPGDDYSIWQWVDKGTMVDGGPHPWTPFIARIAAGMEIAYSAKYISGDLKTQALEVAAKQVKAAATGMANAIISSGKTK